ncbi:DUF5134 domain-containing protein [Streptomyces sp. NPDC057654]|uniref:DUF5134 domain-containing protein n=1 Tax=Streptomyces sp. NPDC057654 TaxID=3346196 RepID=UPI0036B7E204
MHGPPLVGWLLVTLCAMTGMYCLLRIRGAAERRRATGGDALMGLGMAVMAVPSAVLDQRPWGPPLFGVVFGAAGLRALLLSRGTTAQAHHLHHAVGAFAMVYMALSMTGGSGGGHTGHGGAAHAPAGTPLLTGLLMVYFAVYVVRAMAHLVPAVAIAAGELPIPGRAELTNACRLSMGIGMLAMLLTL